jgi:hypothetical protein
VSVTIRAAGTNTPSGTPVLLALTYFKISAKFVAVLQRREHLFLLMTLVMLPSFFHEAHSQTTISGELRIRPELRRGYRTLPDTGSIAAFFIDQRARVNLGYKSEKFEVYGSLQEARVWGEEEQVKDVPAIGVHEFWGVINFCKSLSLKAGRQELRYDDERLLGNADWIAQARSHDAAVLRFASPGGWNVHLGGAFNQVTENNFGTYYPLNTYKTLEFLWANKTWNDSLQELKLSGIAIGDGTQLSDTSGIATRYTFGVNLDYSRASWALHLAAYDQAGKAPDQKSISAYLLSFYASLKPVPAVTVTAGLDYLSGTDQKSGEASDKQHTFSTLYASNHPFYGIADYFLNIPNDTRNGGLVTGYLKGSYAIKQFKVNSGLHYFWLQNNVADQAMPENVLEKSLGAEVDVWGSYSFSKEVNVMLGGSLVFGTESMEAIKGVEEGQTGAWCYVGLSFKPVFYTSAK